MKKFLNLGCGYPRARNTPEIEWLNVDNLFELFAPHQPEYQNLIIEGNYFNWDLTVSLPFPENSYDGILCSHFLEHLDCQTTLQLLRDCYKVLKPEGVLRISFPCAKKFLHGIYNNWGDKEWGEPNGNPSVTFMETALLFGEHKQILTAEAVYCLLYLANFRKYHVSKPRESLIPGLEVMDNRITFSEFIEATK